jgi:Zn ribbon nucleic-acid-binding protein
MILVFDINCAPRDNPAIWEEISALQTALMTPNCKHPKVRIVAREEDAEYVECLDCGEVFDSSEFRDMAIEESDENAVEEE